MTQGCSATNQRQQDLSSSPCHYETGDTGNGVSHSRFQGDPPVLLQGANLQVDVVKGLKIRGAVTDTSLSKP